MVVIHIVHILILQCTIAIILLSENKTNNYFLYIAYVVIVNRPGVVETVLEPGVYTHAHHY